MSHAKTPAVLRVRLSSSEGDAAPPVSVVRSVPSEDPRPADVRTALMDSLHMLGFCLLQVTADGEAKEPCNGHDAFAHLFRTMGDFFHATPEPIKNLSCRGMTCPDSDVGYYSHPTSKSISQDATTTAAAYEVERSLETFTTRLGSKQQDAGFPWPMAPAQFPTAVTTAFRQYQHVARTVLNAMMTHEGRAQETNTQVLSDSQCLEASVLFLRSSTTVARHHRTNFKDDDPRGQERGGEAFKACDSSTPATGQAGVDAHTDSGLLTLIPCSVKRRRVKGEKGHRAGSPCVAGLQMWSHQLATWVDVQEHIDAYVKEESCESAGGTTLFVLFAGEAFPPFFAKHCAAAVNSGGEPSSSGEEPPPSQRAELPIYSVGVHRVVPPGIDDIIRLGHRCKEEGEGDRGGGAEDKTQEWEHQRLSAPFQLRVPADGMCPVGGTSNGGQMRLTGLGIKMLSFN